MVKVLQSNWKLIVTTLLCIHGYVDAERPNNLVWNFFRRLLDDGADGGLPFNSSKHANISSIIDEGVRRARMKQNTATETYSSRHPSYKNNTKQKLKDVEKMKYRFRVQNTVTSKHHSHKDHDRIDKIPANFTGYQGKIHPRGEFNDTDELDKKPKSKPRAQELREQHEPEKLSAVIKNKTKVNASQDDFSKLAVRAGRYRDDSIEIHKKEDRGRGQTTIRMTKMPSAYQLQDDVDDEPAIKPIKPKIRANDRLNPYAIDAQMKRFMDCYKDDMNITMEVIGRTAEYNNIVLLKITEMQKKADKNFRTIFEHKYADEAPEKKIIFIVHGLAVMGMGNLIHNEGMFRTLMSYYTAHLSKFDIFIIPIANPDGLSAILNNQKGKFWNKNMSPQSSCSGVALDRNFDVEWNTSQRISPCSHMYPGPLPFSEPETRAVRDVLHLYSQKVIAYIHVHASSFDGAIFKGDAVLYPRGYTSVQNDDDKYVDIKGDIEESLKNATFRVISVAVEPLYYWYGKVLGTSVDYASTIYGIPYAMEFAMQAYNFLEKDALYQIWRRVIDVVFKNIAKNVNNNND